MDINAYIGYRLDKDSEAVCCVLILEHPITGQSEVFHKIDSEGHYVDGCLQLVNEWLQSKESALAQQTEPLWIHMGFHRSALNVKKAFIKVKDAANACRGFNLTEQKFITKQKLTHKNYTKPVSYLSQVELVKTLVRLGKVNSTCETAHGMKIERAYLLACGHLHEHKEKSQNASNVVQFPSPLKASESLG